MRFAKAHLLQMGFFFGTQKLPAAVTIKHITFAGFMVIMPTNCGFYKKQGVQNLRGSVCV